MSLSLIRLELAREKKTIRAEALCMATRSLPLWTRAAISTVPLGGSIVRAARSDGSGMEKMIDMAN